jgi:ATP-dependent DNA helicase RecQ
VLTGAPGVPVLATTATANARVTADVAEQLGAATVVLRGGLARSSLRLSVVPGLGPLERYAWVDQALAELEGSGIVYVPTVAETRRLSGYLAERGHAVVPYSGQLDPDDRAHVEDALRVNAVKAVVATSALGMGYDKPDLGFCVHVGSPDSPVAYYQQIGRAGRALANAEAVLLPAESDERIWEYFATASMPDPEQVRKVLDVLGDVGEPVTVPALESATGVRRGRLEALLRVVAVDGAVERTSAGWVATGTPYVFDAAKWAEIRAVRAAEADLMRAYAAGRGCLMEFLQRALDDPDPGPCGRCSVCTGALPAPGPTVDPAVVDAVRVHLRGADTVLEPRKRWPTGLADERRGVIRGADEGRALTYADTPGWSDAVAVVAGPDRPLPDDVVQGMVAVLGRWRRAWPARPVAVVPVPSRHHPVLVRDLAERIAAVGRLPLVDALVAQGPCPPDDVPSRPRVDALFGGLAVRADVELPTDGPVLLVDDTYRTGWTMTVAAVLLREAGVVSVMPLVVHQLP